MGPIFFFSLDNSLQICLTHLTMNPILLKHFTNVRVDLSNLTLYKIEGSLSESFFFCFPQLSVYKWAKKANSQVTYALYESEGRKLNLIKYDFFPSALFNGLESNP